MVADFDLISLDQQQKLAKSMQTETKTRTNSNKNQYYPSSSMWNPKQGDQEDDDSWEVRAFEEDTSSIMGATWPPRSYTCTFCRRGFRSAQALGGHMNVHRRDREKLQQARMSINPNSSIASTSSTSPAFGGLCFLYQSPQDRLNAHWNTNQFPPTYNLCTNSVAQNLDFPVATTSHPPRSPMMFDSFHTSHNYSNTEDTNKNVKNKNTVRSRSCDEKDLMNEDLDLELRLGRRPASSPSSSSSKSLVTK